MTSPAALRGQVGGGSYAAAKAGVVALVKTAAVELARHNITANALLPIAATEMSAKVREDPKLEERFLGMIPLRRWATPGGHRAEPGVPRVVGLGLHDRRHPVDRRRPHDLKGAAMPHSWTVSEQLRWVAACRPAATAIVDDAGELTFADFARRVHALAGHLAPLAGERVGLYLANRREWAEAFFACQLAGIGVVPINDRYQELEVAHLVEDAGGPAGRLRRRRPPR